MTSYIVVIRARNQAMRCHEIFIANGVCSRIVNTPREAGVGCGISLEVQSEHFFRAKQLIQTNNITSFYAFFRCERAGNRRYLVKL